MNLRKERETMARAEARMHEFYYHNNRSRVASFSRGLMELEIRDHAEKWGMIARACYVARKGYDVWLFDYRPDHYADKIHIGFYDNKADALSAMVAVTDCIMMSAIWW